LQGVKVCHVNSTAAGGGVAELLARYVPMLQALGVQADWRLIHGEADFFAITKAFHNALQGGHYGLGKAAQDLYLTVNERSAKALGNDYDVYIVHDPQPAAIRHFAGPVMPNGSGAAISTARRLTKRSVSFCARCSKSMRRSSSP
jgi:trehalose synthase